MLALSPLLTVLLVFLSPCLPTRQAPEIAATPPTVDVRRPGVDALVDDAFAGVDHDRATLVRTGV